MSAEVQQVAVLLAFALVLLLLNLKAGTTWLKFLSLWSTLAFLGLAGWVVVRWVL